MVRRLVPFAAILWQHRGLLWQFTLRNVELRHKGSHLGLVWSILSPLLMLALYVMVFGYILGGTFAVVANESRVDYGLGVFLGLALFHFAAEVLATSAGIVVAQPNFVKKVVFPLEILPAANTGAAFFHLLISLGMVLAGAVLFGRGLGPGLVWLPVILFPLLLLVLGLNWLFSALGVFLRDLTPIIQFLVLALMFMSAVFYPTHSIPGPIWDYVRYNPLLLAIEQARSTVLWDLPANLKHIAYLYLTGFGSSYLGHAVFRRLKPAFADVL